jgi:citrate lyase subunit beta/citryl-CoA lyase
MMEGAARSAADFVFLDLEDACAPSEKVAARAKVIHALKTHDWGKKTRAVRVNNLETEWCYQDIIQVAEEAGEYLDVMIVPKVKRAEDVRWVDILLTQIELRLHRPRRIGLEVLIEEVEAMINAEEIARATPRLEALIFGPGDYSASQGVSVDVIGGTSSNYPGDVWHYARNKVIIAARAAGLDAVDGPYADFKNADGYRTECLRANVLGCVGKWAIHPSQIAIANEVFSPTQKAVDQARKLIEGYAKAEQEGLGAVAIDGVMVDAASARLMQNTVRKADLIGM